MKDSEEQNPSGEKKKNSPADKSSEPTETGQPKTIGESLFNEADQASETTPTSSAPSESPQQPPKTRHIHELVFVLASVLVLVMIAYPLIMHATRQNLDSSSWSGYSVSSSLQNPQPQVSYVTASWSVPYINPSLSNTYSAAWIGIGGQYDKTLIQIGTEHNSIFGQKIYSVWYELLPNRPVIISTLKLSPGDVVTASITLIDSITNTWSIKIEDTTTGKSFQRDVIYDSSMLSAEWIVERPFVDNRISSLANFDQVTFIDCRATIDGRTGSISSFPSSQFTMKNDQNIEIAIATPLISDGTSFSVDYKA